MASEKAETVTNENVGSQGDKLGILEQVVKLATLFSHCVEGFGVIHPGHDADQAQKIALTKLGIEQGRLLIFGDVVGISSPPPTIAKHMIPSNPGATNPDPTLPINFGLRDARLDDAAVRKKVEAALNEIVGRPSHLSRDEMMEIYGLKTPKKFTAFSRPALDTNRLEAFREKYALLQDLVETTRGPSRGMSMSTQHWSIRDVQKFENFVKMIREQVNSLIQLLDVQERVDRGMKTDIKAMGWHPDLSGNAIRKDWEKLKLIQQACAQDYPEYSQATEAALQYVNQELRETSFAAVQASYHPSIPKPYAQPNVKKEEKKPEKRPSISATRPKRPGFLSHFKFSSWSGKKKNKGFKSEPTTPQASDPMRSLSEAAPATGPHVDNNDLEPVRSKSLSDITNEPAPMDLDSKLAETETVDSGTSTADLEPVNTNRLEHADTANSLIARQDFFKGVGRIETKDIRNKAHDVEGHY